MSTFLVYIFFGTLGALFAWPSCRFTTFFMQSRVKIWVHYFFPIGENSSDEQIWGRARLTAQPTWFLDLIGFLPTLLGLVLSILPYVFERNPATIIMFISIYALTAISPTTKEFVEENEYSAETLKRIAVAAATNFPLSKSRYLFIQWAKNSNPNVRNAAILGVSSLPAAAAIPILQELVNDHLYDVEAHANLLLLEHGVKPIIKSNALAKDDSAGRKSNIPKTKAGDWFRAQAKPHRIIEFKNWDSKKPQPVAMKKAFPNLYCRDCYRFAEKITNGGFSLFRCPNCKKDVFLVDGFNKVIGQIGGGIDFVFVDDVLKVQAWNVGLNKVIAAEFHTLEIIGGKDIDYDWAINAVIEKITNRGAQHRKMDLVMTNSPQLHINTQRILDKFEAEHKK